MAALAWPPDGTTDVPRNTRLDVHSATRVVVVEEATGREIAAPQEQDSPRLYIPAEPLPPGLHRVRAVPDSVAQNFAGPGVLIDVGGFTVGERTDEEAPRAIVDEATYLLSPPDLDQVTLSVSIESAEPDGLVRFELDLGDATMPLDGELEWRASWNQTSVEAATFLPELDPDSAEVSVRAIDVCGNVGEWSAPVAFDVEHARASGGCSQAPESPGQEVLLVGLIAAMSAIAVRRRATGSRCRDRSAG
jgi:hypothetical protein